MPVAFSLTEFEYVLECDRSLPIDEQTVFLMRPLTVTERADVETKENALEVADGAKQIFRLLPEHDPARNLKAVRYGLLGWRNFHDKNGKPVEFGEVKEGGRRAVPNHALNHISPWTDELGQEIRRRSTSSEDLSKNSGSP